MDSTLTRPSICGPPVAHGTSLPEALLDLASGGIKPRLRAKATRWLQLSEDSGLLQYGHAV